MRSTQSHRSAALGIVAAVLLTVGLMPAGAQEFNRLVVDPVLEGTVHEASGLSQEEAERVFATADGAVYFPGLERIRWFETSTSPATPISLADFREGVDRDFPGFLRNTYGPFILKMPAKAAVPITPASSKAAAPTIPAALMFTDSFEAGMSNWTLDDNTLQLYGWGPTTCSARTGTHSADAVRGGVNSLSCTDTYASSVRTSMLHNSCEAVAGSTHAWLDAYVNLETESPFDTLGFFYADPAGHYHGYTLSGTWTGWFHVVFNLRQWYRVGDVTANACPRLLVEFNSDVDTEPGFGARIDDLTVSTQVPAFLACSISPSPSHGPAPLTVDFSPVSFGTSGSTAYLWSFGDSAGTTSTTSNPSFTYTAPGDYLVRLRLEDQGVRSYAHATIHVTDETPCTLSCTAAVPAGTTTGKSTSFAATATPSGCSGTPSWAWTFGDGATSTLQNPAHAYATPGSYPWTMTASVPGGTCARQGTIIVAAPGDGRKRAVARKPDQPDIDVVVSPSSSAQTFTTGNLSLTIPGGLLNTAEKLTVTRASNAPTPIYDGLQTMAAYDIRLGDLHTFTAPLTIRMKYDPAAIRPDEPAGRVLSASYWEPDQNAWVRVPSTVDTSAKEIVISTNHLSMFSWTMVKLGYRVFFKNHFYIVYNEAEVTDPMFLLWYRNPSSANYADPNTPDYIEDVMAFLIDGYRAIVDDGGFRPPPTPIDVYVGTDLDSFSEKITGVILISLLPQNPNQLRMVTAHELFHRVQNAYYYDIGGMWWHKWWLEATAEYAGQCVCWPAIHEMGRKITHAYLEAPLTDAGPAHDNGYATAHFVKNLVDNGANFRAMFEACADPNWFDAFSFLDGLTTYLMRVHGQNNGLNRQYQKFARYFVFDENSPMPPITDSLHSEVAAYRSTLGSNPGETVTFSLRGGYTAKLWGIWFSDFLFDATTPKRKYTVAVDGTLPAKVEADVYVLKGDKRVAGGGTAAGTLSQSVKSVEVEVEKGDAVYVLAVNVDSSDQEVKVRIGSETYKCHAVWAVATYSRPLQGGGREVCTGNCRPYDGSISEHYLGEIASDKFHADTMWCPEPPDYCRWREIASYDNAMDFTLTEKGAFAENFSLSTTIHSTQDWGKSLRVALPMPRRSSTATGFEYRLTGTQVCSAVTYTSTPDTVYAGGVSELVCDASSYVMVSCEAVQAQPATP